MRTLLYASLVLWCAIACREKNMDTIQSFTQANGLSGRWYLKAVEKGVTAQKTWENVQAAEVDTLVFRNDGVIMSATGLPRCCSPNSLILNGNLVEIKPTSPVPPNPMCARVNCVSCSTWDIELSGSEIVVTPCNMPRLRYVR
ncbi:hypothetical protein [Dyadobacter sandarakinus]|uniref:Lipocalin-like domain-containing protein n=1 Tax=Dyadobacter sandarakinus TaxID=2747268 RepID=A0ABX7I785_9BACT|nr:hypothetical protein [Dyadobacter sandarakinus]QRR01703.1 hypothetical protein HWI92_12680 [Dyadobacter sandarakinus]